MVKNTCCHLNITSQIKHHCLETTHRLLEEEDGQCSDQRHVAQQGLHHHPHGSVKLDGEENMLGTSHTHRNVRHNQTFDNRTLETRQIKLFCVDGWL